jgi:pyruvate ferredoxin oxidoreductase delta subunit
MSIGTVEVIYRGVFQKTLAKNLCRGVVFAARKEGKIGIAFGRYGDSPERNGIPAKQFAVVADTEEELQEYLSRYEPNNNDVTIVADDTLCKGVESWAWSGLQPVNKLLRPGGTLLVVSTQPPGALLRDIHRRETPYQLAIVPGAASFSGMFVFKDDHTDVRLLGALARVAPHIVTLPSIGEAIAEQWKNDFKVTSAKQAHDATEASPVAAGQGGGLPLRSYDLPGSSRMTEGLVIRALPARGGDGGLDGGFTPGRSATFKKFSTRTLRPVIDFATCKKCTLCWLQCPDTSFNITAEGLYDVDLEACSGCGVCEAVCPVKDCIVMVNEAAFDDNASPWAAWRQDARSYATWRAGKLAARAPRAHGFHHPGQYAAESAPSQVRR